MLALIIITFVVAFVYVVVLAVTLILTTFHLARAARTAAALAAGLEAVEGHTEKLTQYLASINNGMGMLRNGLAAVDETYGRILHAAGLKEPPAPEEQVRAMVASEHAGEVTQHASGAGGYHPEPQRE